MKPDKIILHIEALLKSPNFKETLYIIVHITVSGIRICLRKHSG